MPLNGARALLTKIKEKVVDDYDEINMVIVSGNVVTYQPGQLDATDVSDTVKSAYKMIQEVFRESFIFPVFGSTDTFPDSFFSFDGSQSSTPWKPETPKRDQYIDHSRRTTDIITTEWNLLYPFNFELIEYPIDNPTFTPTIDITKYGYYKVDDVPYKLIDTDIIDQTTGSVL